MSDKEKRIAGEEPQNTSDLFRIPERFASINRMILRDINGRTTKPNFYIYDKDEINKYISDPYSYERQLRNACVYLYSASSHFRRLIQYFASLSDLAYVVAPHKVDTATVNTKSIKRNYKKVCNALGAMDIKNAYEKIITVCLREDVFFGTWRVTSDAIILQQLPTDYCKISVIEDNVFNVTFDFSYFNSNGQYLEFYPEEFQRKFRLYQSDMNNARWQELDSPNSFCIKANKDIPTYAVPPFIGILRELTDLEDYKKLKATKTALENYAMLVMNLPLNDDGEWGIDYNKAVDFYRNLDHVLPEEIGSVLSPMPIDKISFERSHTGDVDTVADAENNLFTAAGVSSLLFNNPKASANALLLSIKVDQAMTYSIVKSLESMTNRFLHRQGYGKFFKITFLDSSPFNRKEVSDQALKGAQYGLPLISTYAAANGLMPDAVDYMNFLEDTVLGLKEKLRPLQSSATMSGTEAGEDGESGRPNKDIGELTEEGEATQERGERGSV